MSTDTNTTPLTPAALDALAALHAAATPGPWVVEYETTDDGFQAWHWAGSIVSHAPGAGIVADLSGDEDADAIKDEDADLIVAAVNGLPALIAAARLGLLVREWRTADVERTRLFNLPYLDEQARADLHRAQNAAMSAWDALFAALNGTADADAGTGTAGG